MERRIRLIIQGEDNASRVLSGAARNANASMGTIERLGRRLLTGWMAWRAAGAVFDMVQSGIGLIGDALANTAQVGTAFNKEMSAIEGITRASGKELDDLRKTAMVLGRDTVYTSQESAEAIKELAKAGVDTGDIVNGVASATVNLASAGELSLTGAALAMSKAVNTFHFTGSQAAMVADIMTGAANASATSVDNLAAAYKYVGPIMNAMTSDTYSNEAAFVDLNTAIAMLSNSGIDAGMAGAGLQRALEGMSPTTEKAANLMKELGIITADNHNKFFDAEGDFIGMKGALDVLHGAMSNLTDEELLANMKIIFGQRGGRILQSLMNTTYDGAKSWDQYRADIMEAGVASDTATIKLNNLAGSVEFMKGSVEFLQVTIWTDQLEHMLMPAVDRAAQALNTFGTRAGLPDFQSAMQGFAKAMSDVVVNGIDILEPRILSFMGQLAKPETGAAVRILGSAITDLMKAIFGEEDKNFDNNAATKYVSYMSSSEPATAAGNTNTVATSVLSLASAIRALADEKRKFDEFNTSFTVFMDKWSTYDYTGNFAGNFLGAVMLVDASIQNTLLPSLDRASTSIFNWLNTTADELTGNIAGWGAGMALSMLDSWGEVQAATTTALDVLSVLVSNFDISIAMTGWGGRMVNGFIVASAELYNQVAIWGVEIFTAVSKIDLFAAAKSAAWTAVNGLTGGLLGGLGPVISAAETIARAAVTAWRRIWNSKSPSKVFYSIAEDAIDGLLLGFAAKTPEAIKRTEDLARMVSDVFQSITTGVESLGKLAGYGEGPIRDTVVRFSNDMFGVVETIQAVTARFSADGVKAAAEWSTSAGTVLGIISSGIDALVKLKDYKPGLARDAVLQFSYDAFGVVETIQAVVANFSPDGVAAAATWATSAGTVLGLISGGIDALVKIKDYKGGLRREAVKRFKDDVWIVVEALQDLSYKFTDEGVAWAAQFADGAGRILAPIAGAIDAFTKLRDYQGIMPWQVDMLGADIRLTVDKMVDMARKWDVEGVAAAAVFSDAVGRIIAPIGAAIDTFTKLNEYKGVAPTAVKLISDDMMGTVGHLIALSKTADQEGAQSAALFADASTRIFSGLKSGLDAIGAINESKGLDTGKAAQVFADITNVMNSAINLSKTEGDLGGISFVQSWQDAMLGEQAGFNLFMQSFFADAYDVLTTQALGAGQTISASLLQGLSSNEGSFYSAGLSAGQAYARGVADGSGGGGYNATSTGGGVNGGGGRANSVTINVNGLSTADATERVRVAAQRSSNFRTSVATVYGTGE